MSEPYYKSHWRQIEPERMQRYERMFAWRADLGSLLDRLDVREGMIALDFGCGPGSMTLEMARRVGQRGQAIGADLNEEFLAGARARAAAEGLGSQVRFVSADGSVPLAAGSVDRVLCKNVLEYVPNFHATLKAHCDVLKSGGRILIADSDWGFLIVEPWNVDEVREVFTAAGGAFSEPYIGRKLAGALASIGFKDIKVEIAAYPDRDGRSRSVLDNMAGYATSLGGIAAERMQTLLQRIDAGIADGTYLFVLPQFLVSAVKV